MSEAVFRVVIVFWFEPPKNSYAGTDVTINEDENGFKKLVVDQDHYIEMLQDLDIPVDRLLGDGPLLPREVEALPDSSRSTAVASRTVSASTVFEVQFAPH